MSDISWRAHPDYRGAQAYDLVANAAFIGVDHPSRAFLALAASYRHMSSEDLVSPQSRALVTARQLDRARILGAAMQVAYNVSAAMPGVLPRAPMVCAKGRVILTLPADLGALSGERLFCGCDNLVVWSGANRRSGHLFDFAETAQTPTAITEMSARPRRHTFQNALIPQTDSLRAHGQARLIFFIPSASDRSDMHSFRTDSQFFRDALERIGKAEESLSAFTNAVVARSNARPNKPTGRRISFRSARVRANARHWTTGGFERNTRRHQLPAQSRGRGVVGWPSRYVVHRASRLVGTVCEVATDDGRWSEDEANAARVTIELNGEIIDHSDGAPFFHRGVRSFPSLGAPAHQIRADDLRAIYTFRGRQGVEIGRLSQNDDIPAEIDVGELMRRHFAVLGSTGVGKTTSVSLLLKKSLAVMPKLRIILFDPHNEYAAHFPGLAQIIDSESLELPFWMFKFDELADVVFRPAAAPDERDALYEVIRIARAKYQAESVSLAGTSTVRRQPVAEGNSVTSDAPTPYRVVDVIAVIEEWLGMLDQRFPAPIFGPCVTDLRG